MGLCTPCAGTRPGAADPKLRARHRAGANIKQTTTQNHEKSLENNGPKPFKNQPQIDQKSIENQPKIDPKSIKHQAKNYPKS